MSLNEKNALVEDLPNRLVRIVRKIRRRGPDGRIHEYEQAFHVKKAMPGDRYAQRRAKHSGRPTKLPSSMSSTAADDDDDEQELGDPDQQQDVATLLPDQDPQQPAADADPDGAMDQPDPAMEPQEVVPEPAPQRIEVRPLQMPWVVGEDPDGRAKGDPVPPELRKRFDPKNRTARALNPVGFAAPANVVKPGEEMLWGVVEYELLDRLRMGRMTKFQFAGGTSGTLLVKVESGDGYIHKAFMRIEALIDPYVYKVWGDMYSLDRGHGDLCRRSAAAYEFAKAAGFDDLIPPTAVRFDQYGDLDPIMSPELIERRQGFVESVVRATGEDPEAIRKKLQGFSTLIYAFDGVRTIQDEDWFTGIFQQEGDPDQNDSLNRFFEILPEDRRIAILRTAVLDLLLWTGDRPLISLGFTRDKRHPVVLLENDLTYPDPRALGMAYAKHAGSYLDPPHDPNTFPLLWSDPALLVAIRGTDAELITYEDIAVEAVRRVRSDDRTRELIRALMEHQIPSTCIAGLLARCQMIYTHARELARDPYLVAAYFAELVQGPDEPGDIVEQFSDVEEYVNDVMSSSIGREFDFVAELRMEDEDVDG